MNNLIEKILSEAKENQLLSKEFLKLLDDWVENNQQGKIEKILKYVSLLPIKFRKAPEILYRAVAWKNRQKKFEEGIRSWSSSLQAVKYFIEEDQIITDWDAEIVILKIKTNPKRVVLNLELLGKSNLYKKSVEYWENQDEDFIGADIAEEKEIIYNQPIITEKDIFLVDYEGRYISLDKFKKI